VSTMSGAHHGSWVTENSLPVGGKIGDLGLCVEDKDCPRGIGSLFSDGMDR